MTATLPRQATDRHTARPSARAAALPGLPGLPGLSGLLGGARKVAQALATPLVPADYLDLIDPMRAGADLRGRIVDVTPETADSATLTIKPGRGWRGHTPGQYIRIGVDIDGVRHWRAYSLTHRAGTPDGHLTITPKAIPDGVVSNHLVRRTTPGTMVMLDQATGDFTLPRELPRKALFLTAGSGITPVMGMLRNHLDELPDVVQIHCAPTESDVMFREELRSYAAASRLTLHENLDDVAGVLDLASLDALVPDWRERETWVCGPTGLLDAAEAHWAAAGVSDLLHVERFRPSVVEPGEGGTVTFERASVTVDADGSTPILDAGESAGVLMPSGCRMGICFGCVVTMREGAVRDLRTGDITATDENSGDVRIQTCINAAAGPCHLDL
ncbi:ferredoxin-NADP reductase [Knoellia remsis]|uniref:Ferredoxin-NADP reductase n=1 Tax=Knoellia remsis TaxID=407159 RepID=A0A2T0TWC3_9MICO|nr:ferredoxin reductase [Knoellia remsis]PRY49955.1 ferredoxin-NADP reductase [Knoellia remsis]